MWKMFNAQTMEMPDAIIVFPYDNTNSISVRHHPPVLVFVETLDTNYTQDQTCRIGTQLSHLLLDTIEFDDKGTTLGNGIWRS